ncbi:MAG: hypothetical protein V1809_14405 [Planctomycetota bacterium]
MPQAFYAVSGLESARMRAGIGIDPEVFRRALAGILYTQNNDGSFSNYPSPDPQASYGKGVSAWGLGMTAICLRNAADVIALEDPELFVRGLIAREAGRRFLRRASSDGYFFPVRELAYTLGNEGMISENDYRTLACGRADGYDAGLPEPPSDRTPHWEEKSGDASLATRSPRLSAK